MIAVRIVSWIPSFLVLLGICIIYGFFSTPTPEKFGVPEAFLAVGLLLLVVRPSLLAIFDFSSKQSAPTTVKLSFFYLLIVPTLTGIIVHQNDLEDFARDFIPLLFLFLPIFLYPMIKRHPKRTAKWIVIGLVLAGLGHMFQFAMDPEVELAQIGSRVIIGRNRDNPFQDPAAVFFSAFSGSMFIWSLISRKWILFFASLAGLVFSFAIYVGTVSRAPIGLTLFVMLLTYMVMLKMMRNKAWVIIVGLIIFGYAYYAFQSTEVIGQALRAIDEKTEVHGMLNSRDKEALAVLDNIKGVPILLFGEGWGGVIANPVAGGLELRYVHNILLYYLFKTGIVGLLALIVYLSWCLKAFFSWRLILHREIMFLFIILASAAPLIYDGLLQPMYKVFSFGLLLALLLAIRLMVDKRVIYSDNFIAVRESGDENCE